MVEAAGSRGRSPEGQRTPLAEQRQLVPAPLAPAALQPVHQSETSIVMCSPVSTNQGSPRHDLGHVLAAVDLGTPRPQLGHGLAVDLLLGLVN